MRNDHKYHPTVLFLTSRTFYDTGAGPKTISNMDVSIRTADIYDSISIY